MKDLKISKELLSEVLKLEVVKHSLLNKGNNTFNVTYMPSEDSLKSSWTPVNIYEFAFKCKEWAFSQGYSYIGNDKLLNIYSEDSQIICIANKDIMNWFDINVDFIACEWILQQKGK